MNKIVKFAALGLAATASSIAASAEPLLQGQWRNAKGSVIVRVQPCGRTLCGVVIGATEKAKAGARHGGTENLVGTPILTGLRPIGNGTFKGQVFDPKRNIHAPATVRLLGPGALTVRGCAIAGILCKEQSWTRVGKA